MAKPQLWLLIVSGLEAETYREDEESISRIDNKRIIIPYLWLRVGLFLHGQSLKAIERTKKCLSNEKLHQRERLAQGMEKKCGVEKIRTSLSHEYNNRGPPKILADFVGAELYVSMVAMDMSKIRARLGKTKIGEKISGLKMYNVASERDLDHRDTCSAFLHDRDRPRRVRNYIHLLIQPLPVPQTSINNTNTTIMVRPSRRAVWVASTMRSAGLIMQDSKYRAAQEMKKRDHFKIEVCFSYNLREARESDTFKREIAGETKGERRLREAALWDIEDEDSDDGGDYDEIVELSGEDCYAGSLMLHDLCDEIDAEGLDRVFHVRQVIGPSWVTLEASMSAGTLPELFQWFGSLIGYDYKDCDFLNGTDSIIYGKKEEFKHLHWIDLWRLADRLISSKICNLAARMIAGATWVIDEKEDSDDEGTPGYWKYTRPTPHGPYFEHRPFEKDHNREEGEDDGDHEDGANDHDGMEYEEEEDGDHEDEANDQEGLEYEEKEKEDEDEDGENGQDGMECEEEEEDEDEEMSDCNDEEDEDESLWSEGSWSDPVEFRRTVWNEYTFINAGVILDVWRATDFAEDVKYDLSAGQINWENKKLLSFLLDCVIYKDVKTFNGLKHPSGVVMGPEIMALLKNGSELAAELGVRCYRAGMNPMDETCPWKEDNINHYLEVIQHYD
ncbi:uncharacterized protein LY89DRAFT_669485 [Mollisia scopiformis]|uniref:Uncharacterized protein n=1 Tax=Mollisia scopiformis TaxID=149040 RepID=A0A194XA58_MOLSC|nr:uncharacterized protein LY89DRAFT_669485 [Mollisia scopiformis]KUJ17058.1 hypothetical protein LY89DRAFT_669485 [Mollisia scopiformis]